MKKNKKKKTGNKGIVGIVILTIIAVVIAVAAFCISVQSKNKKTTEQKVVQDDLNSGYITYQGEKYEYNANIRTMLFLGIDKDEVATLRDVAGYSGQSDCIIVAVFDQEKETTTLLEISRDSMVDVDLYSDNGILLDVQKAQIATQYAYGRGEKQSCQLTRDAVSELLYDVRIDDYLSLNMAGIPPIIDSIGGVEITVPKDYTELDPTFVQGATITLNGEQAKTYVRKRDITVFGSNNDRMERQTQFIQALFKKVQTSGDNGSSMLRQFWSAGEAYMTTDMDFNTLNKLTSYTMEPEILKVPGEVREGEKHDEFYVDEQGLQQMIIDTFYQKVE
ncbi:MAG: LCP family protein [Candidatus Ruminococcus intestinipullorum]|nr:LCP family protein [Candidatus Ruminococcus intestinipullorum]